MKTRPEPWERQPGETPRAFAAFRAYRDLGPSRSLAKTAAQLRRGTTQLGAWSAAHAWVIRSRAWDDEQDRVWRHELREHHTATARGTAELTVDVLALLRSRVEELKANPGQIKTGELARLVDSYTRLHSLTFTGLTPEPDDPLDEFDIEGMSDEEVFAVVLAMRRELDIQLSEYPSALVDEALQADALEAYDDDWSPSTPEAIGTNPGRTRHEMEHTQ